MGTMLAFGCGMAAGLLYEKYNKDMMRKMKKAANKIKEVK